jgi:guanine deaminase
MKLYKGNIIFTKESKQFEIINDGYILEDDGIIISVAKDLNEKYPEVEIIDYSNHLIMPGLVDLHFHAVQYGNLGIGLDEELLDWLNTYTFKEESKFSDLDYAKEIFSEMIQHVINAGTTRIVFFSSIHEEATRELMKICESHQLAAYVGKVNMDRNSPDYLIEDSEASLASTKALLSTSSSLVKPIITPRFVPSCTEGLMKKLGELAKEGYGVQTHISENENEIKWVKSLHPDAKNYLDVYDRCGLVTDRTILAHCVFCTDDEKDVIKDKNAYVAHCPVANFNLTSGIMDAKDYLDRQINIGLGTDVGAGHSTSIKEVLVDAIKMSKVNHMIHRDRSILSFSEAFYMATKGGGKYFGHVGSFEKGYELDMLVIKPDKLSVSRGVNTLEQLQRFIYSGQNDMIIASYCKGKRLNSY